VAMGRRLAAVSFTSVVLIRPVIEITMFDRLGAEFTPGVEAYSATDAASVPDLDMSGRRVIVSEHLEFPPGVPDPGSATIVEFESSL